MMVSYSIKINGIVQGVGMRPFIYRLARESGLKGTVKNSSRGVEISVTGEEEVIKNFIERIKIESPPASKITSIDIIKIETVIFDNFSIIDSSDEDEVKTLISPDLAICEDCRSELLNKNDRRYLYPFINCTNCGPRYSIIKKIPYDRPNTTMAKFTMCERCNNEYNTPDDRRFHAQPDACKKCGPDIFLKLKDKKDDNEIRGYEAIRRTKELLREGKIIAIKGLGGFHIACDARNQEAVNHLRTRKRRSMKPFAIMVPDINTAKRFAIISDKEKEILLSPRSPIMLLRKCDSYDLIEEISYQNEHIGIMLPYTPLHILLFYNPDSQEYDFDALVMTSGNISELPIEYINEEAYKKLNDIVDAFLVHNRDIYNRVDDSILYLFEDKEILIRRARGFVPETITIKKGINESVLATGAELKGCFATNRSNNIILSQHLGDLKTEEGIEFFIHTYRLITDVFRIKCAGAILDKHPHYLTREITNRLGIKNIYEVQHHYAHICSVLLENDFEEDVTGFAFDGTGYGDDGAIWGCEVFKCNLKGYTRIAHLRYLEMAGGDSAAELCYIPAISYLYATGIDPKEFNSLKEIRDEEIELIKYSLEKRINLHKSSSCGRLFDAVAFLLGLRKKNSFEGEAAMALEYIADKTITDFYPAKINESFPIQIDTFELFYMILEDIKRGEDIGRISAKFHNYLANIILLISKISRENYGINTIALSGGVFMNRFLMKTTVDLLQKNRFNILINRKVPANDGGISFGQIGHYIYSVSS